jgi:hypothetical protein
MNTLRLVTTSATNFNVHKYMTSRPFPIGVGKDHCLPLATILTNTFLLSSNFLYMLASWSIAFLLSSKFSYRLVVSQLRNVRLGLLLTIPEGVAETFQIFLRDTHILPNRLSYEKYYRCNRW